MNPYHKTYSSGFNKSQYTSNNRRRFLKISAILILDLLFFIILIIKKTLSLTLFKIIPFLAVIIYKIVFKLILVPAYRLVLNINRKQKVIFSSGNNKLFFLFANRYVSHTIAVFIIITTIGLNIQIHQSRAEELGRNSLFAKLTKGRYLMEDVTEEEIIIPENRTTKSRETGTPPPKTLEEFSPAVSQKISLGEPTDPETTASLAQGGSAIIKPDIAETFDTPKPRDKIITYIVKENDTVFDIAENFNVSVNTILWTNKLSSRSIIRPGDQLKLLPVSGVEHTVAKGETISRIAIKYNIPGEDILEVNLLSLDATLTIGQSLVIPEGRPLYTPPPPHGYVAKTTPSAPAATASGELFWPTTCRRITQYFRGWRHTGIDIACGAGSNVYAAQEGVVEKAGWNSGGYGNRIIIKHQAGSKTLYAHLKTQAIFVSPGQYVKKGTIIGLMGSTGRSTGSHLHFEVIENGTRVNPFNQL